MKHDLSFEQLFAFLRSQKLSLSLSQENAVKKYVAQLKLWNKRINLFSPHDEPFLLIKHILPSFYYVYQIKQIRSGLNTAIADIGSGGGLPGLLLAIFFQDSHVVLIESARKKALFLRQSSELLNLHCKIINARVENVDFAITEKIHFATARAVAPLPDLIKISGQILRLGGFLLCLKGASYVNEIAKSKIDENLKISELEHPPAWMELYHGLIEKRFLVIALRGD